MTLFEPGTDSRVPAYKDSGLDTAWGETIKLSASGRANIWVSRDCDMRIYDRNGNLVVEELNANPDSTSTSADASGGLVTNGSFEEDDDSDGIPDGWELTSISGSTNEITTDESTDGAQSFKFTSAGSGGGELVTTDFFPVNDSDELRIQVDLFSTPGTVNNKVRVEWYDVSQVAISNTDAYDSSSNPTSFATQNLSATPPTGARFAKLRLMGITDAASGVTYMDQVKVFYPQVVTGVFDNVTIQDNQVITTTGDLEITAASGRAVNIGNSAAPDLTDALNAFNIGSAAPATNPHLAFGPAGIQAKATGTTAAALAIQTLGGNLSLAHSGATVTAAGTWNLAGQLNADNLRLDGNALSSTNTDGNINLAPNGTGVVQENGTALANKYTQNSNNLSDLANAATALGNLGLTASASEINKLDGLTASTTELNYVAGVTSSIQNQLGAKLVKSSNLSDVQNAPTSRSNLGLGSMATRNVTVSTSAPSGGSNGDLWFQRGS